MELVLRALRILNPNLETDIYVACLPPPSVYARYLTIGAAASALLLGIGLSVALRRPLISLAPLFFLIFMALGAFLPKLMVKARAADIDIELPIFLVYIATLSIVTSPLQALRKLARAPRFIFNQLRVEARRILIEIEYYGKDPLKAFSEVAATCPHKDLRSILEGYVTAVRTGTNPVEYLVNQAEIFIRKRVAEIRARVETLVSLMESFVSVSIFAVVTLFSLSVASEALPALAGQMMPAFCIPPGLVTVSYIVPLLLALFFLLLGKMFQPRSPISESRQYPYILAAHLPLIITPVILLHLRRGSEGAWVRAPLALATLLLVSAIISAAVDFKFQHFYAQIHRGFRMFIDDMRELRRAGIAPEKAVDELCARNYFAFSKYVRLLSEYIHRGLPLTKYIEDIARELRDWLILSLLFVFVDTLEMGGVTVEVLDRYSLYVNSIYVIEAEKRTRLKLLRAMPFIAALIQFVTLYIVLYIFDIMVAVRGVGSLLPRVGPLVFSILTVTNYLYGLVAGLLSEERLSGGFRYSAILMLLTIVLLMMGGSVARVLLKVLGGGKL